MSEMGLLEPRASLTPVLRCQVPHESVSWATAFLFAVEKEPAVQPPRMRLSSPISAGPAIPLEGKRVLQSWGTMWSLSRYSAVRPSRMHPRTVCKPSATHQNSVYRKATGWAARVRWLASLCAEFSGRPRLSLTALFALCFIRKPSW